MCCAGDVRSACGHIVARKGGTNEGFAMTSTHSASTPRPTRRELAHELRTVAADLPLLLTAPLYRAWHLRWGATAEEVASSLPGDEVLPAAQYRTTRAITIDAPPKTVWPWLVQVGCLKAGFYSNDLLDNFAHPSAHVLIPDLQRLEVGQWVSMSPTPSELTAFKVDGFEVNRWLLWRKPESTWVWALTELPDGRTRLVTRIHAARDWTRPILAVGAVILMEFGDFAMMRRMLHGIKDRAESSE
jgi:hypothetical protein